MHVNATAAEAANPVQPRGFLRVKQVAVMLDVHPSTIYRAIETGALTALRVGQGRGGLRIPQAAFEEFLANSVVAPVASPGEVA
jgi:excisionase family DNA binding protein